jgi:hypothetical protein
MMLLPVVVPAPVVVLVVLILLCRLHVVASSRALPGGGCGGGRGWRGWLGAPRDLLVEALHERVRVHHVAAQPHHAQPLQRGGRGNQWMRNALASLRAAGWTSGDAARSRARAWQDEDSYETVKDKFEQVFGSGLGKASYIEYQ